MQRVYGKMRLKAVTGIVLTVILVGMLTLAFNIQPVKAAVGKLYIKPDGTIDPLYVGLDRDGDLYYFYTHIFDYEIIVQRSNIIIDGNGYTLGGPGSYEPYYGFQLDVNNVTIKNTNIEDWQYGVWLNSSSFNSFSGNTITNSIHGVSGSSSFNSFSGNNITNNNEGVYLYDCSNNSFSGNTITYNGDGVFLYDCSNNTVSGNLITNNGHGVWLTKASFSTVSGNTITNNNEGVWLDTSCSNNTVSGNTITNSDGAGVAVLDLCSNNAVSGNTITNNDQVGVGLRNASFNIVSGNNITNNNLIGVGLIYSAFNNTVSGNNITDNNNGVWLDTSFNNKFYYNNFIGNTQQVYVVAPGFANVWDDGYPSGGNYWSDYNGTDFYSGPFQNETGSDGIGDTPYVIDENNQDNYPLWPPLPVHNLDTGINYTTIQEAIDAAETLDGHTIFVDEGTYYEHVVVYKSLSLVGADKFNTTIDGTFTGRVIEVTADNVNITGFTIQHCGAGTYDSGIYASSSGNNISYNIITINTYYGVLLEASTFSTLSGNNITNNYRGVWFIYSDYNTVSGNTITNNVEDGISIAGGSLNNIISGNTITNNDLGVSLWVSAFNTVCGNNITDNNNGVRLYITFNSTVCGNNITDNNNGVYLYFGYENNTFFHNNFIDNTQQVYIASSGFANVWDNGYPSGGNYWSNYTGVDEKSGPNQDQPDSDGIGDTPHTIDAYNQDQYPLMNPHTPQHNIATTTVTPSKTAVGQGYCMNITVTVENQDDFPETFDVTAYYDDTPIETKTVTNLSPGEETTLTFTWNTTGVPYGNYTTITANATIVPGETNTTDNTYTDGWVVVTIAGDVNGNGVVESTDLIFGLAPAYGSKPGDDNWNPNADLNGNGVVESTDLIFVFSPNNGKRWPD